MQLSLLLAIAAAGAAGALARYLLTLAIAAAGAAVPWPILTVNVLGCLLYGAVWGFAHDRWPPALAPALLVGFFGAFTTFSSFAHDGLRLVQEGRWGALMVDLLVQNVGGVAALWAGITLGQTLRR